MRKSTTVVILAVSLSLGAALGCGVQTPLAPAVEGGGTTAGNSATLKAGAPTLVSPINSTEVTTQKPTLTISPATGQFASQTFQYEFELLTDAGAVVTRATVASTSFTVPNDVGTNNAFTWRARAVLSGAAGPYSGLGRFLSPRITAPAVGASYEAYRVWFFGLIVSRNAGQSVTIQGLQILEPDLTAAQVLIQRTSANTLRPRLYLPTGNPSRLYDRTVDLGDLDRPWQWIPRGSTTCEGAGCR